MKKTALLIGPTVAVLLATPHFGTPPFKPVPPPVAIEAPVQKHVKPIPHRKAVRRHVEKVEKIAPGKAVPKKKQDQGRSTGSPAVQPKPQDAGPGLQYPCWIVKQYATGKTPKQLEALRKANGIPKLTPKQEAQARACMKG